MSRITLLVCKVIGALYTLTGLAGLAFGDAQDWYHNLLHLVTGSIALYFGFAASRSSARRFCLVFGAGYVALGVLGFALATAATGYSWDSGLITVSMPDHIHHVSLGTILLAAAWPSRTRVPQSL